MFEKAKMDKVCVFLVEKNKRKIVFCVYFMYFLLLIKYLFVFFRKISDLYLD